MRTSKADRLLEWNYLSFLSANGRLVTWKDIKRWRMLRKEFGKEGVNESKALEKV